MGSSRLVVAANLAVVACALVLLTATRRERALSEILFEVAFRGIVFVPAMVDGSGPFGFLLDTGGAGTHIDRGLADELHLARQRGRASVSGNAALDVGIVPAALVRVGGVDCRGRLLASPLSALSPTFGRPVHGILGGDWMSQRVVELDFTQRRMRMYEAKTFRYRGQGEPVAFSLVQGIPFVDMEVALPNGRRLRGPFLVDTGGGWMTVHIHKEVAARAGLMDGLAMLPETGLGIGGATHRVAARGSSVSIGPFRPPGVGPRARGGARGAVAPRSHARARLLARRPSGRCVSADAGCPAVTCRRGRPSQAVWIL